MKVLLIAAYSDSVLKFRGALIESMLSCGLDVHVACPLINKDLITSRILTNKGVTLHQIPLQRVGTNPLRDLMSIYALFCLMCKIRPKVVLGYTIKPVIYGLLTAWLARVPVRFALITGLGYSFTGVSGSRSIVRRIVQLLYQWSLSKARIIFFQNPDDEALFLQLGITKSSAVTRVVNGSGVDIHQYAVTELPKQPCFLLIARLLGDKGVREYVGAARIVKSRYPKVKFGLVGWIDENPDSISQSELEEWVSEGIVDFKGKLQDVRPAIADCSVYVLPSYREGTPRTVLEAMAMGRAIITTDAPGCRETVVSGENGFLVPVASVDELANSMIHFIETPELAGRYGEYSRHIAEEKYDVNKVNEFMLKEMGLKQ
jgi:glycosyltransferase involved in cell wall biosynthesis